MIEHTLEIEAPQEYLFEISQDYGSRQKWDPFPEAYSFINAAPLGVGAQLAVKSKSKQKMIVEYVSYKPPIVASIKMIKGPWYIRSFSGSWLFKPVSPSKSKVTFKYNIKFSGGFFGVLVMPFAKSIFQSNTVRRLEALKCYAEKKI